ncbi:MAG TPA: hypothetical protein VL069_00540, partial [Opitutus sp.]|nr:hypothetical protein [Opitutus sp.]
ILAYERPADPRSPWKTEVWNDAMHKTHNFDLVQTDADDAHELLVGGKEGVFHLDRVNSHIESHPLTFDERGGAGEVRAGKLSEKTRFIATVEPMHGNHLVVSFPQKDDAGAVWRSQVLDDSLIDAHALASADFIGSGQDQIVVGWRAMNRPGAKVGIKLFTALDSEGRVWSQTLIDDNSMACEDLTVADLNGDGRLDIVASGRATKNVKIYFNEGPKS